MTVLLQIGHNVEEVKYSSLWGAHRVLKRLQRQTVACTHKQALQHKSDNSLKFQKLLEALPATVER